MTAHLIVEPDSVVRRAQQLLDRYCEKIVEFVEAEGRYRALWPTGQSLSLGRDLRPQSLDLEEAERLWQIVEQKREKEKQALQIFWEFREQHRRHLLDSGFLR